MASVGWDESEGPRVLLCAGELCLRGLQPSDCEFEEAMRPGFVCPKGTCPRGVNLRGVFEGSVPERFVCPKG